MESTTLNTYTAPMYVVELLTKILTAVGNITGGDGTDLQDIKTSISNIDTDTNDMNSKLTAISGDLTTASSTLNNISSTINNVSSTTNSISTTANNISTTAESTKSTIDNINNTLTTNIVTSLATLLEYTLAANNKLNFMNPTHIFSVAAGENTFTQPSVLKNITESIVTVNVKFPDSQDYIATPIYPGWNSEVVIAVQDAPENVLQYGY